jgi:hypothetical protein
MPNAERVTRPRVASAEYSYRRQLSVRELLPAVGVAIGAGLFAFYVTRLLLQRTPLKVHRTSGDAGAGRVTRSGVMQQRP